MLNPKPQAPAFAEAVSRRQANFQTISPAYRQAGISNTQTFWSLEFGDWLLFGIWNLGFGA
jgi:hypothetical protein